MHILSTVPKLKTLLALLLTASGLALGLSAQATHLDGGTISYTKISDSTYSLRLLVYQECGSMTQTPFQPSATQQQLFVRNRCGSVPVSVTVFRTVYPAVQVPNKCQQLTSMCTGGNLKGINYVVFEGTYTFPRVNATASACNEWDITYGQSSQQGLCCRSFSGNIATTSSGGGSGTATSFFLQAYLNNNVGAGNSSGALALHTTPFFCGMMPALLNVEHGEPDGDSLAYALVPVFGGFQTPAFYQPGLSGSQPLLGTPAGIQIDQATGTIRFTSTVTQIATVGIERKEFREGQLVGATTLVTNVVISAGVYCGILRDTVFLTGCDSLLLPNGQMIFTSGHYSDTVLAVNACDTITTYSCQVYNLPIAPQLNGQTWAIPGSTTTFEVVNADASKTYEWTVVGGTAEPTFGLQTSISWGAAGQGEVLLSAYQNHNCPVITQTFIQIAGGVSVAEHNRLKPVIAPNPTKGHVQISNLAGVDKVALHDTNGRLLDTWPVHASRMTLELGHYPNGLYYLSFYAEEGVQVEKLVLLR